MHFVAHLYGRFSLFALRLLVFADELVQILKDILVSSPKFVDSREALQKSRNGA